MVRGSIGNAEFPSMLTPHGSSILTPYFKKRPGYVVKLRPGQGMSLNCGLTRACRKTAFRPGMS